MGRTHSSESSRVEYVVRSSTEESNYHDPNVQEYLLALTVCGCCRSHFDSSIHFGKAVCQRRRCDAPIGFGVVEEGSEVPLSSKVGHVAIVGIIVNHSKGIAYRKRIGGGKLKIELRTRSHIAAPVHKIDTIPKVVPSRQNGCTSGRTHGASTMKVLQQYRAVRLGPGTKVWCQCRSIVVSKIGPSNVVGEKKQNTRLGKALVGICVASRHGASHH